MGEEIFWWVKHIVVQYWGWFLGYIIPLLISLYIVHWRDKRGEIRDDVHFDYLACIIWPIRVVFVILWLLYRGTGYVVKHLDSLILIIARHKIHSDETGELWRSPAPNSELYAQWIKVKDKTGVHWIQVPLSIKTAREGVAWTYSLKGDEYHPTVRT